MLRNTRLVTAALAFTAQLGVVRAQDALPVVDDGAREWNQERAGPRLDCANDVAPIARRPVESWRFAFERVLAEPVVWGGVVYGFGEHKGKSRLVALDLETGAVLGPSCEFEGTAPARLAVWRGFVSVARSGALSMFAFQGGRFVANGPAHSGTWPSATSTIGRHLFACDGAGSLVVFDLETGTELARGPAHGGQPCLRPLQVAGDVTVATLHLGERPPPDPDHYFPGTYLAVEERAVRRLGLVPVRVDEPKFAWLATCVDPATDARVLADAHVTWLPQRDERASPRWCLRTRAPLTVAKGDPMHTAIEEGFRVPAASGFALTPRGAWGFDAHGELVDFDASGTWRTVLEPSSTDAGTLAVLAALRPVDWVVQANPATGAGLLLQIRPDALLCDAATAASLPAGLKSVLLAT